MKHHHHTVIWHQDPRTHMPIDQLHTVLVQEMEDLDMVNRLNLPVFSPVPVTVQAQVFMVVHRMDPVDPHFHRLRPFMAEFPAHPHPHHRLHRHPIPIFCMDHHPIIGHNF